MIRVRSLDHRLRRQCLNGHLTTARRDERLIDAFTRQVLRWVEPDELLAASATVLDYRHPSFDDAIRALSASFTDMFILSKGFQFVVDQLRHHIRSLVPVTRLIEVRGRANRIVWSSDRPGVDRRGAIYSRMDKYRALRGYLVNRGIRGAVVVGDSEEDQGMFDAATDCLGENGSARVAIRPKDDRIREAADLVVNDWAELSGALQPLTRQFTNSPRSPVPPDPHTLTDT